MLLGCKDLSLLNTATLSCFIKWASKITKRQAHFCTWNKDAVDLTDNLFSITNRKGGAAETQEGAERRDAAGTVTAPGKRCKEDFWGCKEGPQTVVWSCRLFLCHKMMCAQHWAQTTEPAQTAHSHLSFSYHAEQDGGTQPGSQSAWEWVGTVLLPLCQTCTQQHTKKGQWQCGWCLGTHNYSLIIWCSVTLLVVHLLLTESRTPDHL